MINKGCSSKYSIKIISPSFDVKSDFFLKYSRVVFDDRDRDMFVVFDIVLFSVFLFFLLLILFKKKVINIKMKIKIKLIIK